MILDDLQAADAPSLLLLQFVGRGLGESHILIAGAYRDVELGPEHPLIDTLAELSREQTTRRLYLRGLAESDMALFIQASSGVQPSPEVVRAVHRETEGNPMFVGEVVRLLAADGRLETSIDSTSWRLAIPEGIRQVIGRRVGRLSKEAARTLRVASVLGREFDLGPLEELSGDVLLHRPRPVQPVPRSHGIVQMRRSGGESELWHPFRAAPSVALLLLLPGVAAEARESGSYSLGPPRPIAGPVWGDAVGNQKRSRGCFGRDWLPLRLVRLPQRWHLWGPPHGKRDVG